MKKLYIILALISTFVIEAQNYGKITVYSKDNQTFLISFNGVRWSNDWHNKAVVEYADETDYRVKVWLPRNTNPINFNITSSPGYETVYILEKDQYDAYALTLESKFKMGSNPNPPSNPGPTVTPTPTVAATPVVPVIKEMEELDFRARINTVKNESFDDKKLAKAKFVFSDQYFSSSQAAEFVKVFSFDSKKVEAGKFAYPKTVDKKNYYKVVDVLTFDSYKKDLQNWIMKNP